MYFSTALEMHGTCRGGHKGFGAVLGHAGMVTRGLKLQWVMQGWSQGIWRCIGSCRGTVKNAVELLGAFRTDVEKIQYH